MRKFTVLFCFALVGVWSGSIWLESVLALTASIMLSRQADSLLLFARQFSIHVPGFVTIGNTVELLSLDR